MRYTMPRTPFSTPFSSSKKLLEERVRHILSGPQKRPPLPLLALVLAFSFFSVNLVSCQPVEVADTPISDPNGSASSGADTGSGPVDSYTALQNIIAALSSEDFYDGDADVPRADSPQVVALLQAAASHPLSADSFERNEFWYIRSPFLGLNALAGREQEGYVLVTGQTEGDGISKFVVYSPELWEQVRAAYRQEGEVDHAMLERVRSWIDAEIQRRCDAENQNYDDIGFDRPPEFYDGDVVEFQPVGVYDGLTGRGTAYLYTLNVGLLCRHPERLGLAGGNWVDDQGRLRNEYLLAYMAFLEVDGQITKAAFMAGDTPGILGYSEDDTVDPYEQTTKTALETVDDGASV